MSDYLYKNWVTFSSLKYFRLDALYLFRYNKSMKEIIYYKTYDNKCPYLEWYNSLDKSVRLIIDWRIDRIRLGNLGKHKKFDNLTEIKFVEGACYRIYAYEYDNVLIIFLTAGDKSKQSKDIELAKKYLQEFKERYE